MGDLFPRWVSCEECYVQAPSPLGEGQTVLERVRALESKLPGLQQKLGPYTPHGDTARITSAASGGGASIVARVEALEEAVRVLVNAQVHPCISQLLTDILVFFFVSLYAGIVPRD